MVGSDHDWDWYTGQANPAERSAFANGRASRDAEVDTLRAALRAVLAYLVTARSIDASVLRRTVCNALAMKDDEPL